LQHKSVYISILTYLLNFDIATVRQYRIDIVPKSK